MPPRHEGAQRSLGAPQCRCDQAAGTDEIAMPTIFIGLLALALVLWLAKSFARVDPKS
jgi:hypothetical protein